MDLKMDLNEKQYHAVTTSSPFVRVIAGAGSGKTRVLTYRIAYLIQEMHALPRSILAITFTNKVANEMRERIQNMIGEEQIYQGLSILTFHSFCARFLRKEIYHLSYPSRFTILDEEDQERLIKDLAHEHFQVSKGDPLIKKSLHYIGANKSLGKYPRDIRIEVERFEEERKCLELYALYEEQLAKTYNLDFDDLLLKTIQILQAFPDVRESWQKRIDHILIDEFQDTNDVQYQLLQLLKKPAATLYVVGDPDQTIYTWRGANQDIILDIDRRYQMETIVLDQNYRSTQHILDTANHLISYNRKRVKKNLFTENDEGDKIQIFQAFRADDEASWVMDQIQELKRRDPHFSYQDVAILYRSSYLTLPFEKAMNRLQIPYRIFGGLRFYQRKEIKDVLAYFQLLVNPKNDVAFMRIINIPKRGFGDRNVELLKDEAAKHSLSLYEYVLSEESSMSQVKKKPFESLQAMVKKLEEARVTLEKNLEAYSTVLQDLIHSIGYIDYLILEEDGKERQENVDSLFDDILAYIKNNPESGFQDYMENVSLQSAQDEVLDGDFVTLMTVHTAKGLEFPYVFVMGLNEGVFPSARTLEDNPVMGLEEERRLCYVAYTRAKKRLSLSCNREYSYVLSGPKIPSRFFKEAGLYFQKAGWVPEEKKQPVFSHQPLVQKAQVSQNHVDDWRIGDLVHHEKFGDGIVLAVVDQTILTIGFSQVGKKSILANHPSLSRLKKGGFDA